jgi:hypothetical protein
MPFLGAASSIVLIHRPQDFGLDFERERSRDLEVSKNRRGRHSSKDGPKHLCKEMVSQTAHVEKAQLWNEG